MSYDRNAESSPRDWLAKPRDSPTHVVSKRGAHTPALRSAWIQRIIPSNTKEELRSRSEAQVHEMELEEDDYDEPVVNKLSDRRSWPNSEEKLGRPFFTASEAEFTIPTAGDPPVERRLSTSSDSKVVPISEDEEADQADDETHVRLAETLASSAWFSRITRKDAMETAEDPSKTSHRSFPPLKTGEQWPGTQKPSNLPPLRIPASTNQVRPHHLPFLTPVNVPSPDREGSDTLSLPSKFLAELEQKRSNMPGRRHSTDSSVNGPSSVSDTASLYKVCLHDSDEADSGSVKKMRQKLGALGSSGPRAPENTFSRIVSNSNSTGKSNHLQRSGQLSHIHIPQGSRQQGEDDRRAPASTSGKAAASSKQNLRPGHLQVRGSQQWLQRWCTSKHPPDQKKPYQ